MSPLKNLLLLFLAAQSTIAHFHLNYPTTIGFDDDAEGTAPCGSFTVDFSTDNVTDFHVDSDVIAVVSFSPIHLHHNPVRSSSLSMFEDILIDL